MSGEGGGGCLRKMAEMRPSSSLQDLHVNRCHVCVRVQWPFYGSLFPLHFTLPFCTVTAFIVTWLNPYSWVCLFFTGQGLRGLDVLRCRCSSQFLTPGPVSSPSQLTHCDSFEPLGGAVSGSSGFYTFTESLHPEMFPGTSALQQCAHWVHLLRTVA